MSALFNKIDSPKNVYGDCVELVQKYARKEEGYIHLDIGCGLLTSVEHIHKLGITYVGVGEDLEPIESLKAQGFEAHFINLSSGADDFLVSLRNILQGRILSTITIFGVLEYLTEPVEMILTIHKLAYTDQATVMTSPLKPSLRGMMCNAGLIHVLDNDTSKEFVNRNILFNAKTPTYNSYWYQPVKNSLSELNCNGMAEIYSPYKVNHNNNYAIHRDSEDRRFLSIIIRTKIQKFFLIKDILNCLSGQSDLDFEVIIVGKFQEEGQEKAIENILEVAPPYIAERISFVRFDGDCQIRALNIGYASASGEYIVTLDDDNIVFAHYVESFRKLAALSPGRLLRCRCQSQAARRSNVEGGADASISDAIAELIYPAEFSFIDHLHENFTPYMSLAYPREAFHKFGLRFDENLTVLEDYDFMMRAYGLFGIVTSAEITVTHRGWNKGYPSTLIHSQQELLDNMKVIHHKLDQGIIILSGGEMAEIRERSGLLPPPIKKKASFHIRLSREWKRFKRRRLGLR